MDWGLSSFVSSVRRNATGCLLVSAAGGVEACVFLIWIFWTANASPVALLLYEVMGKFQLIAFGVGAWDLLG